MRVIILAGGKGTRMGSLTEDNPKPMVRVANKPILEYQVELAKRFGLLDLDFLVSHKANVIREYFGDGARWGVQITHTTERVPLGTAGAVKELDGRIDEDFLVFYGDVVMDVDLQALVEFHRRRGGVATLVVHPNDHPGDSDLVEVDGDDRIVAMHAKPHPLNAHYRNLVSAALYVLSPSVLRHVPGGVHSDFGRDIFPALVAAGEAVYAYRTREYIKDVGTVERRDEVEGDIVSGRVARLRRSNRIGAIFLDRDGVLNVDADPVRSPDQLTLLPGVAKAVRLINKSGRLAVVVTNQPDVAKGFVSESTLETIHGRLETLLGEEHAYVDRIYSCPHHPDSGFPLERPEYKINCACRKPKIGMIDRAVRDLDIDLADSFMIGDRTVDIMTGVNAGLRTILLRTGQAGRDGLYDCPPDFVCDDLLRAVHVVST